MKGVSRSMSMAIRVSGGLATALLLMASLFSTSGANAQAAPSISASTTDSPDIWMVRGSGFAPNMALRVMAVDCTEIAPCAMGREASAGTNGPVFAAVTTSATGTFSAQLDFEGAKPEASTQSFLIVAFPGSRALEPTDPSARVHISAAPVPPPGGAQAPAPPPTGTGVADGSGHEVSLWLAGLALVALSGVVVATRQCLGRRDRGGRTARL